MTRAERIKQLVETAPPLTPEQRAIIAAALGRPRVAAAR